mmetsp:Transcript_58034/g.141833  ORF Transcript_58034/g.141833 Transcript_58034/m.141833 type:complete len:1124 (+) Transcript_58034:109-3480(+)
MMIREEMREMEELAGIEVDDGFDDDDPSSFLPPDNHSSEQQCTIQPWVEDRPNFVEFVNTASIRFLHERIPRFGNTRNITEFIIEKAGGGGGGGSETDNSYIWGLAASCLCIVAVAGFWVIVLLICRYVLRTERVGWISGSFRPLPPRPKPKPPVQEEEEEEEGNLIVDTETGEIISATESHSKKTQGDEEGEGERERNDNDEEARKSRSSMIATNQNDIENDNTSKQQQNQGDITMPSGIQVQTLDEETGDGRLGDSQTELAGKGDDGIIIDQNSGDYKEQQQEQQQSAFVRFVENFVDDWFGRNYCENADGGGETSKMTGSYDTDETMKPSRSASATPSLLSSNKANAKVLSSKRTSQQKENETEESLIFHVIHDLDATFHVSYKDGEAAQKNLPLPTAAAASSAMTTRDSELYRLIHDLDSAIHSSFRDGEKLQLEPSPVIEAAAADSSAGLGSSHIDTTGTGTAQSPEIEKSESMKMDKARATMVKTLLAGKIMSSFRSSDGNVISNFGGQREDLPDDNTPKCPGNTDESSQYQKQQDEQLAQRDDDQYSDTHENNERRQHRAGVEEEEDYDEMSWIRRYNRVRRLREFFSIICCVCALAVVVGTILMIIQGVRYMNSTFSNLIKSLNLVQDLVLQASDIVGDAIRGVGRLKNDTIASLLSLNGICPLVRDKVCFLSTNFTDDKCGTVDSSVTLITLFNEWQKQNGIGNGQVLEGIGDLVEEVDNNSSSTIQIMWNDIIELANNFDFETASAKVIEGAIGTACKGSEIGTSILCDSEGILTTLITTQLAGLVDKANWLLPDMISFNEDLMSTYEKLEDYKSTVSTFDWALSLALFFMILSASVALFLLGVLVFPRFASSRVVQRIHMYWVVPIFMFSAFLSLIFTCVFLLGSMSMADFCFDGPEENLLAMAAEFGSNAQSQIFPGKTTYEFLRFYLRRCETPLPTLELLNKIVDENDQFLFGFEEELVDLSFRITDTCGTDGTGALFLVTTTTRIRDFACEITNLVRSFRDLIRCSNIRPLYEQVMYQTICFAASDACWWMAATNFFVVGCSLLLITFRSAFVEIEILDDDKSEGTDMQPPNDIDIKGNGNGDESSQISNKRSSRIITTVATKLKRWTM